MASSYDIITQRILDQLEVGTPPWRKPWGTPAGVFPESIDGHTYRGINRVILGTAGYPDPRFLTYRRAQEMGGQVRKGEKGSPIVFYQPAPVKTEHEDEDQPAQRRPYMRLFTVFNVGQCDGLDLSPLPDLPDLKPIAAAEGVVEGMPRRPRISHDDDRAYYIPSLDEIHLPPRGAFDDAAGYYTTVFHELTHSTGHPSRLNRETVNQGAAFGSEVYSREELVAEFGAAFLSHHTGVDSPLEQSAAYIAGWADAIRRDKGMVITAAARAQEAADYILGTTTERS